jgi:xanthine dehydrogenase accessory factor
MREVLDEYLAWRQQVPKVDIALATVVETWGSSPRPLGSKMIVSSDGKMAGSVSNGCIEGDVYQEARQVLASGQAKLVEYGVADETAFEVGLACGGHIAVLISVANEVHDSLAEKLVEERPVVLETNLKDGDPALLLKAPDRDQPWREGDLFVEPFPRLAHMVIVGAIHIAVPLHRLAKLMGYRVTVVDARAKFATAERFPDADAVVVAWPDEALANIKIDRSTAVVILTHDPKFDLPALRAVLGQGAGYIGAIGSTKTNANRFDALRGEGFTDEQLAAVHGPIGLDLGGRGAEETALGIMAEVTATRHGGTGGFMREVRAKAKESSPLVGG